MICDFGKCPGRPPVVARELEKSPTRLRTDHHVSLIALSLDSELQWPSFTPASCTPELVPFTVVFGPLCCSESHVPRSTYRSH